MGFVVRFCLTGRIKLPDDEDGQLHADPSTPARLRADEACSSRRRRRDWLREEVQEEPHRVLRITGITKTRYKIKLHMSTLHEGICLGQQESPQEAYHRAAHPSWSCTVEG